MARFGITLDTPKRVAVARAYFDRAVQLGWRMEVKEPKRSDAQNDRMWEMLGRISKRMTLNGQKFSPDQWKCVFLQAMGRQVQVLPALDGQSWFPAGFRSSDLSVQEMSDMQTFMEAWAAEQGVDIWAKEDAA